MSHLENSDELKLEADEILNESIMSGTAIIIVEGVDDIPVYEEIFNEMDKDFEVYASENIEGLSEGCTGVIDCLDIILDSSNGIDIEKHILGIIDRDARYYRGEIVDMKGLLILKYYSIESHFLTVKAVSLIISQMTRATRQLVTPELELEIFERVKNHVEKLLFVSLEALKNACVTEYDSILGYANAIGEIRNRGWDTAVNNKSVELTEFAESKQIDLTWDELLKICKGKWAFLDFATAIKYEVNQLQEKCGLGTINKCQYCITEPHDKCLYKPTLDFKEPFIKQLILRNHYVGDYNYIKDRALLLA